LPGIVCGPASWNSLPAAVRDLSSSSIHHTASAAISKVNYLAGRMALIHRSTFMIALQ